MWSRTGTVAPLLGRFEATMSAMPLPYSLLSSMTATRLRVTLGPPPLALYWSTASLTPLLMLIPSCGELDPVRAPKYPIFTGPPPLVPELVVELDPHAAATRARTAAGTRSPQRARVGRAMAILLDVMIPR